MEYVDTKDRTFETRLKFINEIFSNKFAQKEILSSGINFKLMTTLEQLQQAYDKQLQALSYEEAADVFEADEDED